MVKNRGKKATITVDGYTNFLFLTCDGMPKVGLNYNSMLKNLVKKYNKQHKEPLPNITPHSFRHPNVKPETKSFSTFLRRF